MKNQHGKMVPILEKFYQSCTSSSKINDSNILQKENNNINNQDQMIFEIQKPYSEDNSKVNTNIANNQLDFNNIPGTKMAENGPKGDYGCEMTPNPDSSN